MSAPGMNPVNTVANAQNQRNIVAFTSSFSASPPATPANTLFVLERQSRGSRPLLSSGWKMLRFDAISDLPVREHHSVTRRPRLRVLVNRHAQISPPHSRAARHESPVYVAILPLHS